MIIARYINDRQRRAWPKIDTIARELGKTDRTVRDGVHTLVHRGHLGRSKRGSGNLNQYELLLNDLTVEERDSAEAAGKAAKAASSQREPKAETRDTPAESGKPVDSFDLFMAAFPPRDRIHDRDSARAVYEDLLKAGATAERMLLGAEAYRRFSDANRFTGTDRVYGADCWLDIQGWIADDPEEIDPFLKQYEGSK